MTINGTTVDYSQPVALNYGEYKITVAMTGYETYSGTLDVEDASVPVHIDLIEEQATVNNSATATPAASAAGALQARQRAIRQAVHRQTAVRRPRKWTVRIRSR